MQRRRVVIRGRTMLRHLPFIKVNFIKFKSYKANENEHFFKPNSGTT